MKQKQIIECKPGSEDGGEWITDSLFVSSSSLSLLSAMSSVPFTMIMWIFACSRWRRIQRMDSIDSTAQPMCTVSKWTSWGWGASGEGET